MHSLQRHRRRYLSFHDAPREMVPSATTVRRGELTGNSPLTRQDLLPACREVFHPHCHSGAAAVVQAGGLAVQPSGQLRVPAGVHLPVLHHGVAHHAHERPGGVRRGRSSARSWSGGVVGALRSLTVQTWCRKLSSWPILGLALDAGAISTDCGHMGVERMFDPSIGRDF